MSEESLDVPQADSADAAHLVASTLIGMVPFVGGTDLFKFIVTPSLEKRRERWMQLVADAIRKLQATPEFSIELLRDNEEFTTLLVQTSQAAMNTHVEAKHHLLKTALINAAVVEYEFDSKQLFINMLDKFTATHVSILSLIQRTKQVTAQLRSGQNYYDKLVEMQEPIATGINGVMFPAYLEDLYNAGLLVKSDDFIITDGDVEQSSIMVYEDSRTGGAPNLTVSDLGIHFLHFEPV